jgi:hypothetical protein
LVLNIQNLLIIGGVLSYLYSFLHRSYIWKHIGYELHLLLEQRGLWHFIALCKDSLWLVALSFKWLVELNQLLPNTIHLLDCEYVPHFSEPHILLCDCQSIFNRLNCDLILLVLCLIELLELRYPLLLLLVFNLWQNRVHILLLPNSTCIISCILFIHTFTNAISVFQLVFMINFYRTDYECLLRCLERAYLRYHKCFNNSHFVIYIFLNINNYNELV